MIGPGSHVLLTPGAAGPEGAAREKGPGTEAQGAEMPQRAPCTLQLAFKPGQHPQLPAEDTPAALPEVEVPAGYLPCLH